MATKTKREEFEALQQEMAVEQQEAVLELADWFRSDAGKQFADKFIGVRDRTIPNSHYDQVLTTFLSVVGNVEQMVNTLADTVAAQNKPPVEETPEEPEAPESETAAG